MDSCSGHRTISMCAAVCSYPAAVPCIQDLSGRTQAPRSTRRGWIVCIWTQGSLQLSGQANIQANTWRLHFVCKIQLRYQHCIFGIRCNVLHVCLHALFSCIGHMCTWNCAICSQVMRFAIMIKLQVACIAGGCNACKLLLTKILYAVCIVLWTGCGSSLLMSQPWGVCFGGHCM